MKEDLKLQFGDIDIYLFDQLLKGTYDSCHTVLDAGCGTGRNLVYFLRAGFEVYGIDPDPERINEVMGLSRWLAPSNPLDHFKVASAEKMPYEDEKFDLVISSAVLHFAQDADHFDAMLRSMWRVIKPGGYFFARLASDIGLESQVLHLGQGRYLLPDDSERFLVNEKTLLQYSRVLKGELYEPIKTTNVQGLRCMTTWCLQKL